MDKIDVTQDDRKAAASYHNQRGEHVTADFITKGERDDGYLVQAFARHRLATRTDATPVAWQTMDSAPIPENEYCDSETFQAYREDYGVFPCKQNKGRFFDLGIVDRDGDWLEVIPPPTHWMPLPAAPDATNTHPPATDVAAQDDTALLEKLADEACKRLGIDPNEIVDPVGPVRKKDDIIYAMYAFAREKFWDTEPNDVAALVEAAKEVSDRAFMTYRRNGRDHYIEDDSGEGCMIVPHDAWNALRQALAPFTKGQNHE